MDVVRLGMYAEGVRLSLCDQWVLSIHLSGVPRTSKGRALEKVRELDFDRTKYAQTVLNSLHPGAPGVPETATGFPNQ